MHQSAVVHSRQHKVQTPRRLPHPRAAGGGLLPPPHGDGGFARSWTRSAHHRCPPRPHRAVHQQHVHWRVTHSRQPPRSPPLLAAAPSPRCRAATSLGRTDGSTTTRRSACRSACRSGRRSGYRSGCRSVRAHGMRAEGRRPTPRCVARAESVSRKKKTRHASPRCSPLAACYCGRASARRQSTARA